MHRPVLVAILLIGATTSAQQGTRPVPQAFHVGSFGSTLAARMDRAGRLDSGAGVLQLVDGATGQALELSELDYEKGPSLLVGFTTSLGAVDVAGVCLGAPETVDGDRRLVAGLQVKLTNGTAESQRVSLVAALSPGGGDPELRPFPSLAFDSGATFGREGDLITRDGLALVRWLGPVPVVELTPRAERADDTVASLAWELELAAGAVQYLELKLAGPPEARGPGGELVLAEEAFRESLARSTFARKEERLRWQFQFRGAFAEFRSASKAFARSLIGNVHLLRSYGQAQFAVASLSDRPYGHPATDAAVEAEILAILLEWNLDEIAVPYLERLIDDLPARTAGLSPERQLAYVHSLARGVRLAPPSSRDMVLANAILAFVTQPLPVSPWLDPAVVRLDLGAILEAVGLGDASMLPELDWALVDPDSIEGRMQALRREISAGNPKAAWVICTELLDGCTKTGNGSMQPGGELDGRFAVGMLTLQRAMLIDDHGPDLVVFPSVAYGLIEQHEDIDTAKLPTRYGMLRAQLFHAGPNLIGAWLQYEPTLPYTRMEILLPGTKTAVELHGPPKGGLAEIVPPGRRIQVDPEPGAPRGMRFTAKVRKGQ